MPQSVLDFVIRTLKQGNGDRDTISGLQALKGELVAGGVIVGAFTAEIGRA
jgi:hypothetical protein